MNIRQRKRVLRRVLMMIKTNDLKHPPDIVEATEKIRANTEAKVKEYVKLFGISDDQLARKLGLLPTGGKILMKQSWSIETSIHVALTLKRKITVEV